MKLSRRRLLALLAAALGSSAFPSLSMAAKRSKALVPPPALDDLSLEIRAYARRFSRSARHWLLVDPLYRAAERVHPGTRGRARGHAELDDLFDECLSSEHTAWYSVEAHLGDANFWVAGELEEDRRLWARMTSADRAFILDILSIRNRQLPRAETLELLQMSSADAGRIAERFNRTSLGRAA